VFVANETTVFSARSQLMPPKPIGLRGRTPWKVRKKKATAICRTLTRRPARKYSFHPMPWEASTPVSL
jgi:hypothetical protein